MEPSAIDSYRRKFYRIKVREYNDLAKSALQAATFAGAVTMTIVLVPDSGKNIPGANILVWASSLFVVSITGSMLVIFSVKLDASFKLVQIEMILVSCLLAAGFYLLLFSAVFRQQYQAAFIFGTVLSFLFVSCIIILTMLNVFGYSLCEFPFRLIKMRKTCESALLLLLVIDSLT